MQYASSACLSSQHRRNFIESSKHYHLDMKRIFVCFTIYSHSLDPKFLGSTNNTTRNLASAIDSYSLHNVRSRRNYLFAINILSKCGRRVVSCNVQKFQVEYTRWEKHGTSLLLVSRV